MISCLAFDDKYGFFYAKVSNVTLYPSLYLNQLHLLYHTLQFNFSFLFN